MLNDVLQHIAKPGPEYRGAPFWAWNAKLEPEELRRQIRLFKDMGLGGFFMPTSATNGSTASALASTRPSVST